MTLVIQANFAKSIPGFKTVWIVGSSIPYWAGEEAGRRPGGKNLKLGFDITWKGIRGLKWEDLDQLLSQEIKFQTRPDVLIIHAGSNDLTTPGNTAVSFIQDIQCSLYRYNVMFPKTLLIWSALLPRLYWHGAPLGKGGVKIDVKRRKINKAMKKFMVSELDGAFISHDTNINVHQTSLFRYDGTHLSQSGNNAYLNNIQGGLEFILSGKGKIFPPQ